MAVAEITPTEFVERRSRGESLTLLDVREEWELGVASVPDVVHIPRSTWHWHGAKHDSPMTHISILVQDAGDLWEGVDLKDWEEYREA